MNDTRVHLEEDTTPGGLHRLPAFVVYERKAALPKAFAVAEARLAPPADQLLPALRNTDLYRAALLDSPPGWCDSAGEPEIGEH